MAWTEEKLKQLPQEHGFYLRGNDMTRIETFVAAAFAFCITLIMISGDEIPTNIEQIKKAMLSIPAFLFSAAQLILIWFAHASWSKRFGLEDGKTIMLSGLMIMLVLVYVYPMRMMASGMFSWLSNGYFAADFKLKSFDELRFLFYFFALGFALLGGVFWLLHRHAIKQAKSLLLTEYEINYTLWDGRYWLIISALSLCIMVLSYVASDKWVVFAPMLYALLSVISPVIARKKKIKSTDL